MKLCILAYTLSSGGFTTSLLQYIRLLQKKGTTVDLLLFEPADLAYYRAEDLSIRVIDMPMRRKSKLEKFIRLLVTPDFLKLFLAAHLTNGNEYKTRYNMLFQQALPTVLLDEYVGMLDLTNYDCVVSWQEVFPDYFLAKKVLAKRKVGYIHPDYERAGFCRKIDESFYCKLDQIVFVSQATRRAFERVFPQLSDRTAVVPNVLNADDVRRAAAEPITTFEKSGFDLISVCRLDEASKAILRAISISKRLRDDGFDFRWYLLGSGKDEAMIAERIRKEHLQNVIRLLGEQQNPHPYTKHADLFVLQSYYEGRPMSVDEAMIIGTPVLISRYASAEEQVEDGVTGFIADNNEEAIYQKLKYVIQNRDTLSTMKKRLCIRNVEKYEDIRPLISCALDERSEADA